MNTPICDFVRRYAESGTLRLHMPGHKGAGPLGVEALDITEIQGADSLYEADGIIRQSEGNASALFGCPTYYSTEGSSLAIRAMLYLAMLHAGGGRLKVAAGRNAHRVFLSAAALLDLDVVWLSGDSYLSCSIDPAALEQVLEREKPAAVYLTSPDYLGNVTDIEAAAAVCHRHGALLLVDNAHGAYLRFLEPSRHPMDLGADLCCDSAHKTLPVLTGGAYLHIGAHLDAMFTEHAKPALALFGSTSPSYLILQSLDAVNARLGGDYSQRLKEFIRQVDGLKDRLAARGYELRGDEPLKLTIAAKSRGYEGTDLAALLRQRGMECEFADPDFLVLMLTPETSAAALERLEEALAAIPRREPLSVRPPEFHLPRQVLPIRTAALSPGRTVPVRESLGCVLAAPTVGCPPAVPIVACGEEISREALQCFEYYGIETCCVIAP